MKRGIRISILLGFVIFFVSVPVLNAQRTRPEPVTEETAEDVATQAKIDAKEDISEIKWLGCGCIGSVTAVSIAYLWGASPDETRLIGKSSDYVLVYTKAYKKNVRSIRTKYAMLGCGVSGILLTTGCIIALNQETCDPSCGLDDACADPLGLNSCLENFESAGCYESGTGCKSPESCQDEADCATGESETCGGGSSCGSSSSSSNCGGSAEYLK